MRFRRLPRRTNSRQGARTRAGPREPPRTPSMHRRGDLRRRERHSRALSRGGGHLTVKYGKHSMRARCGKLGPSSNEKLAGGREPISSRRFPATETARPPRSEERRVGKSVDLGGRRIIKKKKKRKRNKKKGRTDRRKRRNARN